jgi:hypothetical protein
LRALVELARSRRRLEHVPTLMQARARAFNGREPSSYLLDPAADFMPELPLGDADPLVRFAGEGAGSGRRFELVALPDGGAFDLLGLGG